MNLNIFEVTRSYICGCLILLFWGVMANCSSLHEGIGLQTPVNLSSLEEAAFGVEEQLGVVNCILPGQIRRLAPHVTYVTAKRPMNVTAEDCAIRGGSILVKSPSTLSPIENMVEGT